MSNLGSNSSRAVLSSQCVKTILDIERNSAIGSVAGVTPAPPSRPGDAVNTARIGGSHRRCAAMLVSRTFRGAAARSSFNAPSHKLRRL